MKEMDLTCVGIEELKLSQVVYVNLSVLLGGKFVKYTNAKLRKFQNSYQVEISEGNDYWYYTDTDQMSININGVLVFDNRVQGDITTERKGNAIVCTKGTKTLRMRFDENEAYIPYIKMYGYPPFKSSEGYQFKNIESARDIILSSMQDDIARQIAQMEEFLLMADKLIEAYSEVNQMYKKAYKRKSPVIGIIFVVGVVAFLMYMVYKFN